MYRSSMHKTSISALLAMLLVTPSLAQSEDDSRAVRIIDGPGAASPGSTPEARPGAAPTDATPPTGTSVTAPPSLPVPAALQSPAALTAPPAAMHTPPPAVAMPSLAVANPADLSIEILPGPNIPVGSRVAFRVVTKKPGYLILLDVDSSGKLTQIYPNPASLLSPGNAQSKANYVRPGKLIQIPSAVEPFVGIEFVATPPLGIAMVVGILSDQPVQIVDLPDIPMSIVGHASSLAFLSKLTAELRIPSAAGDGRLQQPRWSVDAKFYQIAQAAN